jgi:SNF2 family DNA or RNA helicase
MQPIVIANKAICLTNLDTSDIPTIKTLYGATFNKANGKWYMPAFYPFGLKSLEDLDAIKSIIYWHETEDIKKLRAYLAKCELDISNKDIDSYVPVLKPYDHQIEGLSYAIHNPRLGLFYDPGLGKTKIACDLIRYLHSTNSNLRVLVLALRVNLFTWKKEMASNSGSKLELQPIIASSPAHRIKLIASAYESKCGMVITYDSAKMCIDTLMSYKFDLIIADESHSLRTPDSARTKAILKLVEGPNAPTRRLILSGTPSLGSPLHLWAQLRFLGKFIVPDSWKFRDTYLTFSPYNKHIVTGLKNIDRLNALVSECSIRKKAIECLDLPDRVIQTIEIESSATTSRLYNKLVNYESITVDGEYIPEPENAVTAMTRCAQVSSGFVYKSLADKTICDTCPHMSSCVANNIKPYTSKCQVSTVDPGRIVVDTGDSCLIDNVCDLVESHVLSSKCIVWAKHHETLDRLYSSLSKITKVLRYDHTTTEPQVVEQEFNDSEDNIVILAQISMGIGVTFKAPVMVYAELSFSLDHWLQSLDRNYGLRAKGFSSLLVQVVVIRNSIAHSTVNLLSNKIDVSNLLSSRPNCVTCDNVLDCLANGVKPFDSQCILPRQSNKTTIPLKEI